MNLPPVDLVYLCFPNNPTGAVYSRELLQAMAALAEEHQLIVFADATRS